jgi:hypothetical protein
VLGVTPTAAERDSAVTGDDVIAAPDVVMDRAFTLPAAPHRVWPWIVQLGKRRAGWYLPRWVEWFMPRRRRGLRRLEPDLQGLAVGDVIPDWGGPDATFVVLSVDEPHAIVYRSTRGAVNLSWVIALRPEGPGTRVHLRLRLGPIRRPRLAETVGGLLDLLTIAGLAAGLRERV